MIALAGNATAPDSEADVAPSQKPCSVIGKVVAELNVSVWVVLDHPLLGIAAAAVITQTPPLLAVKLPTRSSDVVLVAVKVQFVLEVTVVGFAMLLEQLSNTGGAVEVARSLPVDRMVIVILHVTEPIELVPTVTWPTPAKFVFTGSQLAADAEVAPSATVTSATVTNVYILMLRITSLLAGQRPGDCNMTQTAAAEPTDCPTAGRPGSGLDRRLPPKPDVRTSTTHNPTAVTDDSRANRRDEASRLTMRG
jgi:hypothetical protein